MRKTFEPEQGRRWHKGRVLSVTGALGVVAASMSIMQPASAAVPSFPDNVVVFPDRDFVSIEGYGDTSGTNHTGETALVEVTRPGVGVIGSTTGEVSGGDVAFEINHPGGVCWGNGTDLKVTPDIRAGDEVSVTFPDGQKDTTTTSSAAASDMVKTSATTMEVAGTFDPATVDTAFLEQRIIQPDFVPTVIGKRDIRAVPGAVTAGPNGGYTSQLLLPPAVPAGTFLAKYTFANETLTDIAMDADLGERAMNWQVEDADANRQGLTIAEFGEFGGPGFGGCPAGPADAGAPAGTASVVRTGASAVLKWNPVTNVPTASPVTGYSVQAISTPNASGQSTTTGLRVGAAATQATISGLDSAATYTFEVRSMAGNELSVPFRMGATNTALPTLSVDPAPAADGSVVEANAVNVTSNAQVFFTTDGSPVISGDVPADNATLLEGNSIPITAPVSLRVMAFNSVGNHSELVVGDYKPSAVTAPLAPTNLVGSPTQNSVALTWDAVAGATSYQVTVSQNGTPLATQPPVTTIPRQTVSGLSPGTTYQFSVVAKNAGGTSAPSATIERATAAATDRVTITSAKWKASDFKVIGTGSQVGATIQLWVANASGAPVTLIQNASTTVVAGATPAAGDWTIRLRTGVAPTSNPGRIVAVSSGNGVSAPINVSNG